MDISTYRYLDMDISTYSIHIKILLRSQQQQNKMYESTHVDVDPTTHKLELSIVK